MSNITEIIFVIDKSGSMQHLVDDTIGGFNGFVENQKDVDGMAYLTTILFSSYAEKLHDHIDIREVPAMDKKQYVVGGMTAMLDTIGNAINEVQNRIDNTDADKRPDNILFVITTDGMENASSKFKKSDIQKMIDHQTKGHGWKFIFLGANMDAVSEASSIGIDMAATYTADAVGTQTLYKSVACAASSLRSVGEVDALWSKSVEDYTISCETANGTCSKVK